MKKIFKITFCVLLLLVVGLYLGIVLLLPQLVNSKSVQKDLCHFVNQKSGTETTVTGLNLKISPLLTVVFKFDNLNAKNNNVSVADINNFYLKYKLLNKHLAFVSANNIFIDGNYFKQFKKEKPNKKKSKFELKNIPEIHISNLVYKSDEANINVQKIDAVKGVINLKITVNTPFLKEGVNIGDSGSLQVVDNKLKANKFEVTLGNSHLYLDGTLVNKNKNPDFKIIGEKLPASELMATILHIQKLKEHERKFIENFTNFKGTANVDLKLDKDGIWGTCTANNLGAEAWFGIPLYFKDAVFYFRGQNVDSTAVGTLGKEKVTHTLKITDLLNPQKKLVVGTMDTTLTNKFKYVPNLTVLNSVKVNLVYKLKLRKPDVYYNIDIPEKSDMIFNSFYLGLRDYKRKIYGNTFKDNSDLYLRKYKYSYFNSNGENIILSGDGLFIKNIDKSDPDRFVPQYISCHTNGYAPISVMGSFGEKVRGGEFQGDLKYDFKNNQVLGTFDIVKARLKAFHIEKAHIVSKDGLFNITSDGLYKGEKYSAELTAKNNIFGENLVYNMKLFLDKLVLKTTNETAQKPAKANRLDSKDISRKVKEFDLTINNWEIAINEIKRDKFVLNNVKLLGSMKNNVFDFKMNQLNFAGGTVFAKGIYDFGKNISKMSFEAKNIDSNKAANMMLNLQDQIDGTASAKVELSAKDMFKYIDAHCDFEVKEGFLPKLGDTEFMIQNSKYKLSEIINIDLSQKDLMKDDIKGTFDVHNTEIKNINVTTWHELSAMYLKGNYEMEKQLADLQLFWKYNKEAPKGIRVFCVPLRLILKVVFRPEKSKEIYKAELSKIPAIKADEKHTIYYRVHLDGDINNNKINLIFKEIK